MRVEVVGPGSAVIVRTRTLDLSRGVPPAGTVESFRGRSYSIEATPHHGARFVRWDIYYSYNGGREEFWTTTRNALTNGFIDDSDPVAYEIVPPVEGTHRLEVQETGWFWEASYSNVRAVAIFEYLPHGTGIIADPLNGRIVADWRGQIMHYN